MKKLVSLSAFFLFALLLASTVHAAAYLKFDGIDGESKDSNHDKWIDVLSIDWGMHKPGAGATGASRRRGQAVIDDIVVVKELDKSTPKIAESLVNGEVISEATLELTEGFGEEEVTYLVYKLENVRITSYNIGSSGLDGVRNIGSSGEDGVDQASERPTEHVSFNFEKVEFTYTEFDDKGEEQGQNSFIWNLLNNRRRR